MTYDEFLKATRISNAEVGRRVGHTRFYLNRVQHGQRPMTRRLALKIWRSFGVKVDPISAATDKELEVLARFEGEAA